MSFSIGIVGLPNVGKSTLFKALTKKQVDAQNYPFCTIDPNVGVVKVPDERIDQLASVYPSEQVLATTIEFTDIAGLVKGASQGEGLGNKFLQHIKEVDAIAHVVRDFKNDNIIHVAGQINPTDDISVIHTELILADLALAEKRLETAKRSLKSGSDKDTEKLAGALEKLVAAMNENKLASTVELTEDEEQLVSQLNFLTKKPMLFVVNLSEEDFAAQPQRPSYIPADAPVVFVSAKVEAELSELSPEEAKEMLQGLGIKESGLDQMIRESYKLLNLITYFTCGPKETRAWTIEVDTKAPQAAGVIHTDFEKGFIRAEVIDWKDFVDLKGESKAREAGKLRTEGKDYTMQDGDVCHFLFNK